MLPPLRILRLGVAYFVPPLGSSLSQPGLAAGSAPYITCFRIPVTGFKLLNPSLTHHLDQNITKSSRSFIIIFPLGFGLPCSLRYVFLNL